MDVDGLQLRPGQKGVVEAVLRCPHEEEVELHQRDLCIQEILRQVTGLDEICGPWPGREVGTCPRSKTQNGVALKSLEIPDGYQHESKNLKRYVLFKNDKKSEKK